MAQVQEREQGHTRLINNNKQLKRKSDKCTRRRDKTNMISCNYNNNGYFARECMEPKKRLS